MIMMDVLSIMIMMDVLSIMIMMDVLSIMIMMDVLSIMIMFADNIARMPFIMAAVAVSIANAFACISRCLSSAH
jgi:hypothetical protein